MLEALLRRDRLWVLGGLAVIILIAWFYLVYLSQGMMRVDMPLDMPADMPMDMPMDMPVPASTAMAMDMDEPSAPEMPMNMSSDAGIEAEPGVSIALPTSWVWQPREYALVFAMWAVMMVAMMMPSASPMILTFAAMNRRRDEPQPPFSRTGAFSLGYLLVWVGFSLVASVAQGMLHQAALLDSMMVTTSTLLASLLLIVAGIYQWTPLKHFCLQHCRSPLAFLLNEWRDGTGGALAMGVKHGSYCLGCCWSLMALLFVAGVMNLLWIAALAILVLVEKATPWGGYISRVAGVAFAGWGVVLAVTTLT